jgi:hypothetical protein
VSVSLKRRFQGGEIMSLHSFGVSSTSFYIPSIVLLSSLYLDEFYKRFTKHFLKSVMFSKDLLKFHCVKISYIVCAHLLA